MAKRKTGAKQTQNRDTVGDKIKYNAGDMGLGEAKSKMTSKVEIEPEKSLAHIGDTHDFLLNSHFPNKLFYLLQ